MNADYLLEPHIQRSLLIRGCMFVALGPALIDVTDHRQSLAVRALLDELHLASDRVSRSAATDLEALHDVAAACAAKTDELARQPELPPVVSRLLNDLRGRFVVEPLTDIYAAVFGRLVNQSQAVYQEAWREARLMVAHKPVHPRGARLEDDPYALTATTAVADNEATVTLVLCPDLLEPATIAALAFVLAHEAVCHVASQHPEVANDSPFAEGFMDWAAQMLMKKWASVVLPEIAVAVRHHTDQLAELLSRPPAPGWHHRRQGHRAAEDLLLWLEQRRGLSLYEAEVLVARLAVAINSAGVPLADKDLLVARLRGVPSREISAAVMSWADFPAGDVMPLFAAAHAR